MPAGEQTIAAGKKIYMSHFNGKSKQTTSGFLNANNVIKLQWAALVNRGYVVQLKITDQMIQLFESEEATGKGTNILEEYLKYGKNEPFFLRFKLVHRISGDKKYDETKWVNSIVDSITPQYINGLIQFVVTAIDPVTWFLKRNVLGGNAFKGTLYQYYSWLIDESNKSIKGTNKKVKLHMEETKDANDSIWYTFRRPPIDNIRSSLFLGNAFSPTKSPYIITVDRGYGKDGPSDFGVYIKDQQQLKTEAIKILNENKKNETMNIQFGSSIRSMDVSKVSYQGLYDNWVGYSQSQLISTAISTTTGDLVDDSNYTTINKTEILNSKTKPEESFSKSRNKQGDYITPISEVYDGSWGKYESYVDSVGKQKYADIVKSTMRIKLALLGRPFICKPDLLGSYPIKLNYSIGSNKFFLNGLWILYGFEHVIKKGIMNTNLFLYRLDHDYNSKYTVG